MNLVTSRCKSWAAYLAVTLFYCRDWFCGRLLLSLGGDEVHSVYSSMVYFHEWTARGVWPLWNMLSACGAPFAAGSFSSVNFYYLAARFLEAGAAYNAVIFISIWFSGIFLYEFLLRKGCSPFASWVGGFLWMIGTAGAIDSGFFCLSLSFLWAEIYRAKRSRSSFIYFTLSLALYAVNAHPQHFLYGSFFIWLYLGSKHSESSRPWPAHWVKTALPFLIAVGITSFYWFRLAEWTLLSNRSAWTLVQAWLPTHYPLAVFPKLYHLEGRPDLDFIVPRFFQWFFSRIPCLKSLERVLEPPYMGWLSLLGILAGIHHFRRGTRKSSRFFLISAGLTALYLLIHPLLYLTVIRHIPIWSGMTNIGRLFDVYQFSLSVLAAEAVDFVIARERDAMHAFDPALADWINVKYLLTSAKNDTFEGREDYPKIYDGKDYRIYQNRRAMPRAFLVPEASAVEITAYEPNRLEMDFAAPKAGSLALSDTYYPGWKAWLDGRQRPILLNQGAFRAVSIPPGSHHLTMKYQPASLRVGMLVSFGAVLVLLIVSKILT